MLGLYPSDARNIHIPLPTPRVKTTKKESRPEEREDIKLSISGSSNEMKSLGVFYSALIQVAKTRPGTPPVFLVLQLFWAVATCDWILPFRECSHGTKERDVREHGLARQVSPRVTSFMKF